MANVNVNAPSVPFGAISVHRLVCAIEDGIATLRDWDARRRTARELSRLSRRQLIDIGLGDVDVADFSRLPRR